jgi:hypothetical protein
LLHLILTMLQQVQFFLNALFHLTLLIFLMFMLIGKYKDRLGLFYGPTRVERFWL